jgi:hypothetical protein
MMSCSHVVENLFRTLEKGLGFALPNLTFLITKNILSCVEILWGELYSKGVREYFSYANMYIFYICQYVNILHLPICAYFTYASTWILYIYQYMNILHMPECEYFTYANMCIFYICQYMNILHMPVYQYFTYSSMWIFYICQYVLISHIPVCEYFTYDSMCQTVCWLRYGPEDRGILFQFPTGAAS